uniref:Ferritin n=1 Tax=Schmidtea mediterranea TaxID=79327 RepID=A0AA51NHY3_SCHMD|nr:ferritin B [Schmidtea mediterranea]
MSLSKVIEVPEVEREVSNVIGQMLHLCQGYRQSEMRFLSDEINLPTFARLFELIRILETRYIEEIIRFQISRGQKVTWQDIKPVENLEASKPVQMLQIILDLEKSVHQSTINLCKLGWKNLDLALTSFLENRVILKQIKVIRKRANQLRDLKRSGDEICPMLTSRLSVRFEVEKLEERVELEIERREWRSGESRSRKRFPIIGSMNRF